MKLLIRSISIKYLGRLIITCFLILYPSVNKVQCQIAVQFLNDARILDIKSINDSIWLATDKGAYRIDGNKVRLITDSDMAVSEIEELNGHVWLLVKANKQNDYNSRQDGLYLVQDNTARPMTDQELDIDSLSLVGERAWLNTSKGVYMLEGGTIRRISNENESALTIEEIQGQVWLLTIKRQPLNPVEFVALYRIDEGTHRFTLEKGEDFQQGEGFIKVIEAGDQVWVLTSRKGGYGPAYRIDGNNLRRISDNDLRVTNVVAINGQIWMLTLTGAYKVEGNTIRRITSESASIRSIENIGGKIWLLSEKKDLNHYGLGQAYRIQGDTAYPVFDESTKVRSIQDIDNRVWLSTSKGAYLIEEGGVRRIPDVELRFPRIAHIDGQIWIASQHGAFRVDGYTARRIPDQDLAVRSIEHIGGYKWLWTMSDKGINSQTYLIEGDTAKRIPDENLGVNKIETLNDQVWFQTSKGLYRFNGLTSDLIFDLTERIGTLKDINGQTWITTEKGAYRIDGDTIQRFPDETLTNTPIISSTGRCVWIGTGKGIYCVEGNAIRRLSNDKVTSQWIKKIGTQAWITDNKGAYRVDEDVFISAFPRSSDSWWQSIFNWILPDNFWISGVVKPQVTYKRLSDGKDPYDDSLPRQFTIIMESDKQRFDKAVADKEYISVDRFERSLSVGKHTVYISVRDNWGNTFDYQISGWVLPGQVAGPVLLISFWLMLLAVAVARAPNSRFCNSLLMNPWIRKYGSFWLIPLILTTIPKLGQHVLRRYLRGIRQDEGFAEWQSRFLVPTEDFLPERFGSRLENRHLLLLTGQSGIGKTSFFKYLVSCYVSAETKKLLPKGVVPIFLPLSRYQGEKPENMIYAQLSNYGQFTDSELATWFLQQGRFLILIDGLNEVDEATRQSINTFVDRHWKANYFCISSQEPYPEFRWMEQVELSAFGPEKVKEMLTHRLGEQKAESVIKQFDADAYETYSVPQDLEFAIELMKEGQPLPQSKQSLYEAVLSPILEYWVASGRADYQELLFNRAYEMLRSRDAFFDQGDKLLPDELRDRLFERKLLVRRGEHYLFRHDLVRAYLASKHFGPRWQRILRQEGVSVDSNWRPMLEFVILSFEDSDEAKELMFELLRKNKTLVGELFQWINHTRPELCKAWVSDFELRYGDSFLKGL